MYPTANNSDSQDQFDIYRYDIIPLTDGAIQTGETAQLHQQTVKQNTWVSKLKKVKNADPRTANNSLHFKK